MNAQEVAVSRVARLTTATRRWLLAGAVALLGGIDIASAVLSHPPDRLIAVRRIVPTEVLDTSRTFTLLAGVLLLLTAWGLRRGKRRAFVTALLLCAVSVPVNVLKALDVEEATVATALMFALGVSADAFRVRSRELSLRGLGRRFAWGAVALAAYVVVGAWMLEAAFGPALPARVVLAELLHRILGVGESVAAVAPHRLPHATHRIFEWYLRSLPVLGLALVLGTGIAALRPARHRRRHREEAGHVATLFQAYGDGSVSPFALAGDTDYFFSANRRAVVPYRFESDTLLAIGDPLGPPDELPSLLADFEAYCRDSDWEPSFFQARGEHLPLYAERGWRALHIGEDPVLHVDQFTLEGSAIGDVRRASRKAAERVEIHHFRPGDRPFDPHDDPRGWMAELRAVSGQWLRGRRGSEKGFCTGRFDPAELSQVWLAVAWNPTAARVEAFVTWRAIPARRGWVLDLMRRRDDATAGVMELLVVKSVEHARAHGDAIMSLALSALVKADRPEDATVPSEPKEVATVRAFLLDHLSRFYDFRGLFHWKSKFAPTLEPRYLVYASPSAISRVALALVRAQSTGGWDDILRGLRHGPKHRPA